MEYKKGSHSVYGLQYHIVLVVKYRRKCIKGELKNYLLQALKEVIEMREGQVLEMNSDLDHVHLLVELSHKYAIKDIIASLKGATARKVRNRFPEVLAEYFWDSKSFWSDSYFISTTGGACLETIQKYIEGQGTEKRRPGRPRHSSTSQY